MDDALIRGNVEAIRLLQPLGGMARLPCWNFQTNLAKALKELHPHLGNAVQNWSPELHWSFPGPDRRIMNWCGMP